MGNLIFSAYFFLVMSFVSGTALGSEVADKIIVIWYGVGLGHRVSAETVYDRIVHSYQERGKPVEVKMLDIRDFSLYDPQTEESGKQRYLSWATFETDNYSAYFDWYMEKDQRTLPVNFDLNALGKYIVSEKPKAVIGTYWGAGHCLFHLKKNVPSLASLPSALFYTDYGVHRFSTLVPEIDRIYFGSKNLLQTALKKYPELNHYKGHLSAAGVPVNIPVIKALRGQDRQQLKKSLGLRQEAKTIVMARGGEAYVPMHEAVIAIARQTKKAGIDAQILVFGGATKEDKSIFDQLQKQMGEEHLRIFPRIPNGEYLRYIRAADLFVTKPGGVSLTEAGLLQVPMVMIAGLGGQERDGRIEFEQQGIAYYGASFAELADKSLTLLSSHEKAEEMREKQARYFEGYNLDDLTNWVSNAQHQISWTQVQDELLDPKIFAQIQKSHFVDPVALRNWYYYLSDIALADLTKNQQLRQSYQQLAKHCMERALQLSGKEIKKHRDYLATHSQLSREKTYEKKWLLFKGLYLDYHFHRTFNAAYQAPDRHDFDGLIAELVRPETDAILNKINKIWEYSARNLNYMVANFYFSEQHYNKAVEFADRALLSATPMTTNETLVQIKGDVLLRKGRIKEALTYFEGVLTGSPHLGGIRLTLANLYNHHQLLTKREAMVQGFFDSDRPIFEAEYFRLASVYTKTGDFAQASNILERAIAARPDSLPLLAMLLGLAEQHFSVSEKLQEQLPSMRLHYDQLWQLAQRRLGDYSFLGGAGHKQRKILYLVDFAPRHPQHGRRLTVASNSIRSKRIKFDPT